jgi:hypothetical protein
MHPYSVQDLYNFRAPILRPDMMIRAEKFPAPGTPRPPRRHGRDRLRNLPGGTFRHAVHPQGPQLVRPIVLRPAPIPRARRRRRTGGRFTALIESDQAAPSARRRNRRAGHRRTQGSDRSGRTRPRRAEHSSTSSTPLRIGVRILIGQHAALRNRREGWVGIIRAETSPAKVTRDAVAHAENDLPPVLLRRAQGRTPRQHEGHV